MRWHTRTLLCTGRCHAAASGHDAHRPTRVILGVSSRPGLRIMVACRPVDFRKGMNSLAALVTRALAANPFAGDVFIFRSRRSDRLKVLVWDGTGLCLVTTRLASEAYAWLPVRDGAVTLNAAQLRLLFTGMDWTRIGTRTSAMASK
jgi:transposase